MHMYLEAHLLRLSNAEREHEDTSKHVERNIKRWISTSKTELGYQVPFRILHHLGALTEKKEKAIMEKVETFLGLMRIRVKRGINLVRRDTLSSDPFVVIKMGQQKLKTRVVKNNCNPEWNEELTLAIKDPNEPVYLQVYDKDTFTGHDEMGEAQVDIKPYLEAVKLGLQELPNGTEIKRVQPTRDNNLSKDSIILFSNGKIIQDMVIRLRNVETGQVEIQLEWINAPGCKGLNA